MYKPPENANRVKEIKSKFENIDKNHASKKEIPRENLRVRDRSLPRLTSSVLSPLKTSTTPLDFQRQLSDPSKRIIKRTPAFRLDKNAEKVGFQRNGLLNRSLGPKKLSDCDIVLKSAPKNETKPVLLKSKSSHDFNLILNRFSHSPRNVDKVTNGKNPLDLYTEPIPKELRAKKTDAAKIYSNLDETDFHNSSTLKIADKLKNDDLTSTLKNALKKPLPKGPAPKKPPRTFTHGNSPGKNTSFIHSPKPEESPRKKVDPKYMLNKLENALRNNKLRSRKTAKNDLSTTSGEDSDDSLLYKSKTNRLLPLVPDAVNSAKPSNPSLFSHAFNLNCLNTLACSSPTYERLAESNSTFFINPKRDEPVYAEPFQFDKGIKLKNQERNINDRKRNSLYYMSSPVLCETSNPSKQSSSPESESLSSFTSDMESPGSTPLDEKSFDMSVNIKNLIGVFENNKAQGEGNLDERVDDLRNSLRETIDQSFSVKQSEEEAKNSQEDLEVDKFKTYVKNVSIYSKIRTQKQNTLFYCCLIVEMNADVRRIKFKFPHNVQVPHKIEDLCFPEAANGGRLDPTKNAQCYSLVITDDKGERTFGYCRRVVPEGSNACIPIAYCLLSRHNSPRFYKKILIELESRHGISEQHRDSLLKAFYFKKFPQPGESIRISLNMTCGRNKETVATEGNKLTDSLDLSSYVIVNEKNESSKTEKDKTNEIIKNTSISCEETDVILNINHNPVYENSDLNDLHNLPEDILKKIFSSLLLERKVILISCLLSKLSSCVEALQTILYPFLWPHTFIPVLPKTLWEFVESPTPIICGILSIEVINEHQIDDGLVVDLDEGSILKEEGDEDKILSKTMWRAWHKSLAIAKTIPPDQEAHSYHLSDAYLHMFVIALRTYRDYIVNGNFQKEAFIRSGKSRGIRRFLKWFTDTTMFLIFIDSVMNNTQDFSLFDKKIAMYGSDMSAIILNKLLEWKK